MRLPWWAWRLAWTLRSRLRGGRGVGDTFPDFSLRDLADREHRLSGDTESRVTVLWFTNLCEDCRSRVPLLEEMRQEAGERARILAVSLLAVDDPVAREVALRCSFPLLLDPTDVTAGELGLEHPYGACPLNNLFLLDRRGRILFRGHLSALSPEAFRRMWRGLLPEARPRG